jgi:hypothetical protein
MTVRCTMCGAMKLPCHCMPVGAGDGNTYVVNDYGRGYADGFKAATSDADAKYMPVIERLVEAVTKQQKQLRILIPQAGIVNDERMALMAGDDALALAAPLLAEKRGV